MLNYQRVSWNWWTLWILVEWPHILWRCFKTSSLCKFYNFAKNAKQQREELLLPPHGACGPSLALPVQWGDGEVQKGHLGSPDPTSHGSTWIVRELHRQLVNEHLIWWMLQRTNSHDQDHHIASLSHPKKTVYPLVNVHITMENHHFSWVN